MTKKRVKLPKIKRLKLEEQVLLQAADLTRREAKVLARYHRGIRICKNQVKVSAATLKKEGMDPPELFRQIRLSLERIEEQVNKALDVYIDQHPGSRWMRSIGFGIEQTALIYTLIDPDKLTTVSALYRYCGLDPSQVKLRPVDTRETVRFFKDKYNTPMVSPEIVHAVSVQMNRNVMQVLRASDVEARGEITWSGLYRALRTCPWNHELKEALHRAGIVIRRNANGRSCPYTPMYRDRKAYEEARNARGDYAELAAKELRYGRHSPKSISYQLHAQGFLSKRHLDTRARRWTLKVFLSHLFEVMYYERHRVRPKAKPYVLEVLGARREIICPMWPFRGESGGVDEK